MLVLLWAFCFTRGGERRGKNDKIRSSTSVFRTHQCSVEEVLSHGRHFWGESGLGGGEWDSD